MARKEAVPQDDLTAQRGVVIGPLLPSQKGMGMRMRRVAIGGKEVCRADDQIPLIAKALEARLERVVADIGNAIAVFSELPPENRTVTEATI